MIIWYYLYKKYGIRVNKVSLPVKLIKQIYNTYSYKGMLYIMSYVFLILVVGVAFEELAFRVIPSLLGLFGLIVGNIVWSYLHLYNFYTPEQLKEKLKDKKGRIEVLTLFSEFFSLGIVLVYVYLTALNHYISLGVDMLGSIILAYVSVFLTHLIYDMTLVIANILVLAYSKYLPHTNITTTSLIYNKYVKNNKE